MVYPAYDQCIKASHCFNLLDARIQYLSMNVNLTFSGMSNGKDSGEAFLKRMPVVQRYSCVFGCWTSWIHGDIFAIVLYYFRLCTINRVRPWIML